MYLIDTAVIREAGRGSMAHAGVLTFFEEVQRERSRLFLAAVSVGELSRALALIRQRGEEPQARQLEDWLGRLVQDHGESLLALDARAARLWGLLLARHPQQIIALQIAAIALVHDLTLVTRQTPVLGIAGVRVRDPWAVAG
ncbi:VapC toxin family PIN domain ribonuclease [Cyanobium sp. AMD-g]|uniref:PIN domain-containing protein n=1 Tax=Cyanobium sp. AMD-g TaxID=2823699 RepID=UPI0020CBEED1|nr:PIN domain-containing protein [Cyanobium sp. AMD-g]MCP9931751.1 VapC toxin family PIN domain ribonuclease [Cyanobium sp. AMD-g]